MTTIELTTNEITSPGLYIMRWQGKTGLARIVGEPKSGWKLINPENPKETLLAALPKDGQIPKDALFSEPLTLVVA